MTALEITLVLIGVAVFVVSFFIEEKLSPKDLDYIAKQSKKQLDLIIEKEMKQADQQILDKIEEHLDDSMAIADRGMEKETNEKIMAISEYSDTVLEAINKSHNEIMFLYSMLNDKHSELTGLASELSGFSEKMKAAENEILGKLSSNALDLEHKMEETQPINQEEVLKESVEIASIGASKHVDLNVNNHNDKILECHKAGLSDVEIAKELGLGLGEVKLVLGLYQPGEA
ncbi:MAG: DUF6115 domain-containing protein [Agathobacter sp.]|nr:DUF6115 domain-containing protein [Agathobacter sp.]